MSNEPARKYDFDRVFRLLLTVGGAVATLALLRFLADVLVPFAVAVLLAYLLDPIVGYLDRKIRHRPASVLITVLGSGLILLALAVVMIPILHGQLSEAAGILGELRGDTSLTDQIREAGKTWPERYQQFHDRQSPRVQSLLDQIRAALVDADLGAMVVAGARKLAPGIWGVLTGVLSLLLGMMGLIVIVLYLVFLLIDYPAYSAQWRGLLPPAYRGPVVEFLEGFASAMSRYFRGQALIALAMAVLFAVGFSIIGLRMSILLGLFIGALNMVPYLQAVGLVPALLLGVLRAVEQGSGLLGSLGLVLIVFAVAQVIQDALLTPRIMGKVTGLRPVAILLGVFVWGKLLGFLGLVLAIPLTCLGLAYYQRFVLGRDDDQPPSPEAQS
ncbi:MAG: AI-2E family transporter [Planctomycetes bacterium]|nr:AI-2E family transporter [Planctomycetota bacterium]